MESLADGDYALCAMINGKLHVYEMRQIPPFNAPPSAYQLDKQLQQLRPGCHLFLVVSQDGQRPIFFRHKEVGKTLSLDALR